MKQLKDKLVCRNCNKELTIEQMGNYVSPSICPACGGLLASK